MDICFSPKPDCFQVLNGLFFAIIISVSKEAMKGHRKVASLDTWPASANQHTLPYSRKSKHNRSLSSNAKEFITTKKPWPDIFFQDDYCEPTELKNHKWILAFRQYVAQRYHRLRRLICPLKQRKIERQIVRRTVEPFGHLNKAGADGALSTNKIKTTRYTFFTFLPKNIYEQFHRLANVYFLSIAFLNFLPEVGIFTPALGIFPILFVLSVSAAKDLFEDRRRYRMDKSINHLICHVYNGTTQEYLKKYWKDVHVGDVIKVSCNEIFPADALLLNSSDPNGVCYMETSSLDGENCLKPRFVANFKAGDHFFPNQLKCKVDCELPNHNLHSFDGYLINADGKRHKLTIENFLARGCELRNTDYVEGLVLYTGAETKAMLNCSQLRYKQSQLERRMNSYIFWCVIILFTLCTSVCIGKNQWLNWFVNPGEILFLTSYSNGYDSEFYKWFVTFIASVVLFQTLIPISLYVTMEMVKLGQIYLIGRDQQFVPNSKRAKVECRSMNIPEELGQVDYILSDKTGTLTENQMVFKRCVINGVDYKNVDLPDSEQSAALKYLKSNVKPIKPNEELKKLIDDIFCSANESDVSNTLSRSDAQTIVHFFNNVALCNTVVINALPDDGQFGKVVRVNVEKAMTENIPISYAAPWEKAQSAQKSALSSTTTTTTTTSTTDELVSFSLSQEHERAASIEKYAQKKRTEWRKLFAKHRIPLFKWYSSDQFPRRQLPHGQSTPCVRRFPSTTQMVSRVPQLFSKRKRTSDKSSQLTSEDSPTISSEKKFNASKRSTSLFSFGKHFFDLYKFPNIRLSSPTKSAEIDADTVSCVKIPVYEAQSPDELALVHAAAAYGIRLAKRQAKATFIQMPNRQVEGYEIVHVLPFSSTRRRMSVIVKKMLSDQLVLYCKGADSSVLSILSKDYSLSLKGSECIEKTKVYLDIYAKMGLRTLCFAKRTISPSEYRRWFKKYDQPSASKEQQSLLKEASAVAIEQNLELLGASAVEDRLQPGVPACIDALQKAGIKIWILTGDKVETAINIANSCKLFKPNQEILRLDANNWLQADALLTSFLSKVRMTNVKCNEKFGLAIHGRTLTSCLRPPLCKRFVTLLTRCSSVICARVTPQQKAFVTKFIKSQFKSTTMAIGDGANDIPMLQAADVGVGISGNEGVQAVMSSDFSISRFMMIKRLLLVHGHHCYDRLARMALYFFYKNSIVVYVIFFYQFFCGFSMQAIIDPIYFQLYNVVFTALPPMAFGILEKDFSDEELLANPQLYSIGRNNEIFNLKRFCLNTFDSVVQSVVLFAFLYFFAADSNYSMNEMSFTMISALNFCCQIHLLIEAKSLNAIFMTVFVLNFLAFFVTAIVYNIFALKCCSADPPYKLAETLLIQPSYWFVVTIFTIAALFPRAVSYHFYNNIYSKRLLLRKCQSEKLRQAEENLRVAVSSALDESVDV